MNGWLPRSAVPLIEFPAIADPHGARLLALEDQLDRTQWWPPERLRDQQRRQLARVLDHCVATVPFYRQRLAQAGYRGAGDDALAALGRLPVLTRETLQADPGAIRSRALPSDHGRTWPKKTSGTTGRAVEVSGTDVTELFWQAFTLRDHLWHRRDFSGKLAAIRWARREVGAAPEGLTTSGWGMPLERLYRTGAGAFLNVASATDAQLDWLSRTEPDYLLSYPSQLAALAGASLRRGLRFPRLREVRTVGETVTDAQRDLCRRAFGVPLTDVYTCEEAGYLALQCPAATHYHVQAEGVLVEVLDGQGRACEPGEQGRVVITTLHNFATPLLRYALGDFAETGVACACGRGLPVLGRILGRTRNRLRLPGGETRFPYLGEREERERIAPSIRQFQYVQKTLEEIEYRIVTPERLTADQEAALRRFITANLGHPFRITISYYEDIPRSASGKYEEFMCAIDD
jgi:phenylacetate-CoA ligase